MVQGPLTWERRRHLKVRVRWRFWECDDCSLEGKDVADRSSAMPKRTSDQYLQSQ